MRNQIVILAAGKGTRMGGGDVPKVLVMLKNKPLIFYVLHEIEKINQLAKPVIVVGYRAEKVQGVLGDQYLYAYQDRQLGTAHALMAAKPKVSADNILVLYGDMPFIQAESLKHLIKIHLHSKAKLSMLTAEVKDYNGKYGSLEHYGRILRDGSHRVLGIVEYKDADEGQRAIKEVNPGIYMFNAAWLWQNIGKIKNQNAQQEYYLTDIVAQAITQGEQVNTLPVTPDLVLGINTQAELELAARLLP